MAQSGWSKEHTQRYRETDGADGHIWKGFDGTGNFPCLLLTTTGHKSGEVRTTPLIYGYDGDDYVVIASTGGRANHPFWYLNLSANPSVEIQVEAEVSTQMARTAGPNARPRLWTLMTEIYPPYDDYQKKAAESREIPVVVLSRA